MTRSYWDNAWLAALAIFGGGFLVTFLVMELDSILMALRAGRHFSDYTLSDNVRRWVAPHRWLIAAIVGLLMVAMWVHFFVQVNPVSGGIRCP